jgi:hypothetical protein
MFYIMAPLKVSVKIESGYHWMKWYPQCHDNPEKLKEGENIQAWIALQNNVFNSKTGVKWIIQRMRLQDKQQSDDFFLWQHWKKLKCSLSTTFNANTYKLGNFFNWALRHEVVFREWWFNHTHYLTSALDGDEWSASRPGRFTLKERAPGTHWIGGWVGPRAVLEVVVKRKISSPRRESNPRTPQSSSP